MKNESEKHQCRHCEKQIKKPFVLCDKCENDWIFEDERESKHKEE